MKVEVVDGQALEAIRSQWEALAGRAVEPNIFYDPDFALPAARGLGLAGALRAVLVWRTEDPASPKLIGFFPFLLRQRWGLPLTVAEAFIHPYAMSSAPVVDSSHVAETLRAFLDWLEMDRAAAWLFRFLPDDSVLAKALRTEISRSAGCSRDFDTHERAVLDATSAGPDHLEHALGAKARKNYRRLRRRLAELGAVTHSRAVKPGDIGRTMEGFLKLESSGWKGRRGTAAASQYATAGMLREIASGLAAQGQCRIDALRFGGKAIAMAVSLGQGDRWWLWKIAYDEDYARFSPGVLLVLDLTETALKSGAEHYDSCALPGHPMIEHVWRQRRAYVDLLVLPARLGVQRQQALIGLEAVRRKAERVARRARALILRQ